MRATELPGDVLRMKLLVAGVPEAEHSAELLAGRMPDLDPSVLQGLSADAVAELFLYLVAKGIVDLRTNSDRALLDLPWGSHVCQFYSDKDELVRMLVPYFRQGLERNEACVWLVGDLSVQEAQAALAATVPNLDDFLRSGQMQILHYTDLYTDAQGEVKPPDQLSTEFASLESLITDKGFEGVRASGSVAWVKDPKSMARFMEYETSVNLAIQNARMTAVCTYPAEATALCQCRELIHNHGRFFVQRGEWVHDRSRSAQMVETIFSSLLDQSGAHPDEARTRARTERPTA